MPRLRYTKSISAETTAELESRLESLESAIANLTAVFENEDSVLYQDQFSKKMLTKYLGEAASIRRRLAEVKRA